MDIYIISIGRTLGQTGNSLWKVGMEKESLSHRSKLICGQGLLGRPEDQALGDIYIAGKLKIRKDIYLDLLEGLFPL